jgi:hypothetical protein
MSKVSLFIHAEAAGTIPAHTKIAAGAHVVNVTIGSGPAEPHTLARAMVVSNVDLTLSADLKVSATPGFQEVDGELHLN